MAKRKKEYTFDTKPEQEQAKEKAPPAPTQGPILNAYLDKIVDFEAFRAFLNAQFNLKSYGYTPELYLAGVVVMDHQRFSPWAGVNATSDGDFFLKYKAFFETFTNIEPWPGLATGLRLRNGKGMNASNWRIWRDLLRFNCLHQMITKEGQTALTAVGITPFTGSDNISVASAYGQRVRPAYMADLAKKYQLETDPSHMLHLSPIDSNFIRFTPDEKSRERDLIVETTISKYLRKYHPSLTDGQLRTIAEMHKLHYSEEGIVFFSKPEEIENVYLHGPSSCMSKGGALYKTPVHPAQMYGDSPGVRIAALAAAEGTFSARTLIFDNPDDPADKRYIRVYGDDLLRKKLEKKGYKQGNFRNVKLRKLPFKDKLGRPLPGTYVFPYIDDVAGGANGRSGAAQYAYTEAAWDYWLIVCNDDGTRMRQEATKTIPNREPEFVAATGSSGAMGSHVNYDQLRHASYEVRYSGGDAPYREPQGYLGTNRYNERRCGSCNHIYDEEHVLPFLHTQPDSDEWKHTRFYCVRCAAYYIEGENGNRTHRIVEKDGQKYVAAWGAFYGIHKESGKVYEPMDMPSKVRSGSEYEFIFSYQLKNYGHVRLFMGGIAKIEDAVEDGKDEWFLKKDLITTVFGAQSAKQKCYFLGQTAEGVMQYIPHNTTGSFTKSLVAGKFVVVDGRLEYRDKNSFSAKNRKKYFAAIKEFDEEEDDAPVYTFEQTLVYEEPFSMLDVLNTLFAYYTIMDARNQHVVGVEDYIFTALRRLFPKIDANLMGSFAHEFPLVAKSDRFAGLEGVPGIHQQMTMALAHGDFQDGDIEIDKKTGEAYLSATGVQNYIRNYALRLIGIGSAANYVKTERPDTARNKKANKQIAAGTIRIDPDTRYTTLYSGGINIRTV